MKMSLKRVLALVLCAAMLFGMLPMQQVKAEDDYFIGGFIANNTAELVEALTEAERMVAPEKVVTIQIGEPFELTQEVSVPGGCRLDIPVPFTIAAGVTMRVYGNLEVTGEMTNKGILANNGNVTVYGNAGGSLAFTATGKYTGSGEMMVINSTYEDIIPGLDLSGYDVVEGAGIGGTRWIITAKSAPAPGPDGMYHFTTFAELQQLAELEFDEMTAAVYDGNETFVFDNITLPFELDLEFIGSAVVVPEWITVEVHGLSASWLTVSGNLHSDIVIVDEALTVNGTVTIQDLLSMRNYTELNGADNVVLMRDEATLVRNSDIISLEEFEACIADAAACTDHRVVFELFVGNELELTKDYNIPANANFRLRAPVTIAQGATLTLNGGNNDLYAPLTIAGTLVNNNALNCAYDNGGLMDFTQGGTYAGQGHIYFETQTLTIMNLGNAFPGLSGFDGYEATQEEWGWILQYVWGNYGDLTFTTMEELKELAAGTYDSWTWANYVGSETFVIDESITLPRNLPLGGNGATIEIAEGVVVDVHEGHFDKLVVNGTLNIEGLQLYKQLDVNGTLHIGNSAYFNMDAVVNGAENISYANDRVTLGYYCGGDNLQSLKEACILAENETNPRVQYVFYLRQEETLSEDLTVPENVFLQILSPLTVAEGATLTLNAEIVYMQAPVTVYGALQHNGWANINSYPNAMLTIAEGATYSGDGVLVIHGITDGDPTVAIPGLDTTGYELQAWESGDTWQLVPEGYNPGGGGNVQTFASFEELKELASQSWEWTWIKYTGGDVLEITEDIVLPENLNIQTSGGVRIAEGVNAWFNYLTCGWLEVNGALHVEHTNISEYLNVTGSLTVAENIYISSRANLEGRDKIVFANQWAGIYREFYNVDLDECKERIVEAEENAHADSRMHYSIHLTEEPIVLEESLTIPSMVNVYFEGPLTVAAGATLTLNSENVQLYAPATVYGILENNSWIYVGGFNGATLTFAEGSTYTGRGTIAVEKDPSVSLESVLPGLDLSQWEVRQDGDWWWYIGPIGGGGNGLTFSTMEQLQALAAESYDWGYMMYVGSEDFVISEDLSMPMNTYVDFGEHNVVVSEDVTANFMELMCNDLTVHGTLNAENMYVMGDVVVNGAIKTMHMSIGETTSITGLENIKFTNSYNPLSRIYYVNSGAALVEALNKAANPKLPKETAIIQFNGGPVILTEDATLPKNCELYISNDMVIAEGATLTINGMVSIGPSLTVKGTLVNNNDIYTWDGRMIIAQGGKYEGHGTLRILGGNDYNTVFQGLNLDDFQISNNYGEWQLVYVAGLSPVAAPSELEWGYTYDDGVKVALPGAVSWKSGITDTTGIEYVYFYRINEDGSETLVNQYGGVGYDAKNYMAGYNSSMELLLSDIPSGRYYFTVYSQGDYKNTKDSETVRSSVWEYTKPSDRLDTATNLGWSDDSFRAEWTNPNGADEIHYTLVSWYYKDREDGNMYVFSRIISQDNEFAELREYYMAMMGTGYYSYAVQFISADITKTLSSELSERSEWYHLEKMPETPTAQLGGLLNDPNKSNEEKLEEVQNMDTEVLKDIMEENSDAMNILVQLETNVAGGTAQVDVSAEVSEEIAELVVEEISIVGANLNSKKDESVNVTLVIDKVEEERDITGNYDTSTAVQFSMTLDNVKDTKNLEVPVVVTIPVPAGIAADKVVVLHYHDDGTYDVINPEVSIVGGKAYAQFILTSFSDFAILEKLAALLGDVDLNEGVDVDDVLTLLWYVLFPDDYPIDVEADYDHNGSVDVDDVLTLLWYVLFPDDYPLTPPEPVKPVMGTVMADNLNVREEPVASSKIVVRLAINTRVEILSQKVIDGVNWGQIAEGWINMNYVRLDS